MPEPPDKSSQSAALWLVAVIAFALIVGGIASMFTASAIPLWYSGLAKSPLTPPNWVFPLVWTALYMLMGFAQWLIWRRGGFRAHASAHIAYLVQLALNVVWPFLFFGLHLLVPALIEIGVLAIAIGFTMFLFWRIDARAGWCFALYLCWVVFASYLNYEIIILNRTA